MKDRLTVQVFRDHSVPESSAEVILDAADALGLAANHLSMKETINVHSFYEDQWTPILANRLDTSHLRADLNLHVTSNQVVNNLYERLLGSAAPKPWPAKGLALVHSEQDEAGLLLTASHELGHLLHYRSPKNTRSPHCTSAECLMFAYPGYEKIKERIPSSGIGRILEDLQITSPAYEERAATIPKQLCRGCNVYLGKKARHLAALYAAESSLLLEP